MLKKTLNHFITAIFLLAAPLSLFAADKLTLDDRHSYVLWHINHLGFSTQTGKIYVKGFVTLDKDQPKNSIVEVTVDINKLETGIPELDTHLKSAAFFDVSRYPIATYISNKVDVLNKTSAKVYGTLIMHGVSKPVTLMVKINKVGINPVDNVQTVGFSATTQLKRSEFNMTTYLPDLGDEVTIEIAAEAKQPHTTPATTPKV